MTAAQKSKDSTSAVAALKVKHHAERNAVKRDVLDPKAQEEWVKRTNPLVQSGDAAANTRADNLQAQVNGHAPTANGRGVTKIPAFAEGGLDDETNLAKFRDFIKGCGVAELDEVAKNVHSQGDISKFVEKHHKTIVDSIFKNIETIPDNLNGDISSDVKELVRKHLLEKLPSGNAPSMADTIALVNTVLNKSGNVDAFREVVDTASKSWTTDHQKSTAVIKELTEHIRVLKANESDAVRDISTKLNASVNQLGENLSAMDKLHHDMVIQADFYMTLVGYMTTLTSTMATAYAQQADKLQTVGQSMAKLNESMSMNEIDNVTSAHTT